MENISELFPQERSAQMLPPQLESELNGLRKRYVIDVVEEPTVINLVIRDFPTSNLYNRPSTNLLLRIPRSYPDAGLDMFWTDLELLLLDSGIPNGAQAVEQYLAMDELSDLRNKHWRRFSWHPQPGTPLRWNPSIDNLYSYLEFVRRRFTQR